MPRLLPQRPASATFHALGTTARVCVTNSAALEAAHLLLVEHLDRVDVAASRFRADSELSMLNRDAGALRVVSADLFSLLVRAMSAARRTGGLVDPTVGGAMDAIGWSSDEPDFERIRSRIGTARSVSVPGWRLVHLDPEQRTVLMPPGMQLDLGATAKAAAADDAADMIQRACGCGVLVELGGDVAVAGLAPRGGWRLRVVDDHAAPSTDPAPIITVDHGAVATSSTTVRRWRMRSEDTVEREVHHVIDPRTGCPATGGLRSVSVTAATCVEANAATTAAIVLGPAAEEWLRGTGLPARIVADDGAVRTCNGWPTDEPRPTED